MNCCDCIHFKHKHEISRNKSINKWCGLLKKPTRKAFGECRLEGLKEMERKNDE